MVSLKKRVRQRAAQKARDRALSLIRFLRVIGNKFDVIVPKEWDELIRAGELDDLVISVDFKKLVSRWEDEAEEQIINDI